MEIKFLTLPRFKPTNSWVYVLAISYLTVFLLISLSVTLLPLPYLPNQLDLEHLFQAPFTHSNHWLGTDQLGRDVFTNLLYGCQTALLVSFPAMLLATFIGV